MLTKNKVNKTLAALGFDERIEQGNGYLYFYDGRAHEFYSNNIPVCRLNHTDLANIVCDLLNMYAESQLELPAKRDVKLIAQYAFAAKDLYTGSIKN